MGHRVNSHFEFLLTGFQRSQWLISSLMMRTTKREVKWIWQCRLFWIWTTANHQKQNKKKTSAVSHLCQRLYLFANTLKPWYYTHLLFCVVHILWKIPKRNCCFSCLGFNRRRGRCIIPFLLAPKFKVQR